MVRFTRFKDCELILGRANRQLQHNRSHSVQQDFSDKVRKHRHILGERMVQERRNDNYAVIRYDKLIVNGQVYKYNDITQSIVPIGTRRPTTRQRPARGIPRCHPDNNNDAHHRLDGNNRINHVNDDVSERIPHKMGIRQPETI
ncbi:hypothetical protein DPMN_176116 [Dreissena polymorpha]|uniref:Uncharacterized protein n=1 Tax=Dreissena polymorpha TaxID=45954 RepID=A0A9D4IHU2_DREPO|nr:hypothetical protein DPMN_176116 [Dreissena polymorpha]